MGVILTGGLTCAASLATDKHFQRHFCCAHVTVFVAMTYVRLTEFAAAQG